MQYHENTPEREGYVTDLEIENFENDLHHADSNVEISDSGLLSDCLYTNVDHTWDHFTIKLVFAITNHKRKSNNKDDNIPIVTYKNSSRVVHLNNWENLVYFMAFLPSLFLFGIGDHVSITHGSKKRNVPLDLWSKWVLLHHSKR